MGHCTIQPPECLKNVEYDKIVIATIVYFDEVKEQLISEMGIDNKVIKDTRYFVKKDYAVVIQGYASDHTGGNRIALDDVIKENVNFKK